jgi:hypothetical protein
VNCTRMVSIAHIAKGATREYPVNRRSLMKERTASRLKRGGPDCKPLNSCFLASIPDRVILSPFALRLRSGTVSEVEL